MNWWSWLLWGFLANVVLMMAGSASQGLGLTRMNLAYMLGTILTPDRDRARFYGQMVHVGVGWAFSLIYVIIFQSLGAASWWRGMIIGIFHGLFVLIVLMSLMPGLHPRMASEQHGPEAHNMLEPPGFFGLNYGRGTPLAVLLSHAIFGAILGAFYRMK
jgi:Na+(H+)/acetate symporter ActP